MRLFETILEANVFFANGEGAIIPFLIIGVIVLALLIRLGAGSMDDGRIHDHVQQQGGRIRSINWSPFGRGWFGSENERIYEVVYEDAQHNVHKAYCKTSALAGVYWTEDNIIETSEKSEIPLDAVKLAAENKRLQAEIERLKKS